MLRCTHIARELLALGKIGVSDTLSSEKTSEAGETRYIGIWQNCCAKNRRVTSSPSDAKDGPGTQIYGADVDIYEGVYLAMI
ncbi:MAG: hypothetical protein ACC628_13830 [Pirellulaceae bacterium]